MPRLRYAEGVNHKPGPITKPVSGIDLASLAEDYPQRAIDLVALFGYKPYTWQRKELAVLCDPNNRPPLAYEQIARKNGKTALAVMVALTELILLPERHIYAVSDSERNLTSVFWQELRTAVERSGMGEYLIIHHTKARMENPWNGSFLQLRPGNFEASQGINPHLVIADEVHLIKREVWNGYLMSTAARSDALVLGITTPGYSLDGVAHDLYRDAKATNDPDLHARIFEPSNPECALDDITSWIESNPALDEVPGLRDSLRRDAKRMPENDYRRFRLGQWTSTEKSWLPYGAFRALATGEPIPDGSPVWLGFDGSWSGDTTALVACDGNGKLQVIGHWHPPALGNPNWRVPIAEVEQTIRETCARWEVEEITCDPARWSRTIQELEDEGLPITEYPQSLQRMIPATGRFYDAVMDGALSWVADDKGKALEAHVSAAETKASDQGVTIRKPAFAPAAGNIDCAIAAVLAHDRASRSRGVDLDVSWINIRPAV